MKKSFLLIIIFFLLLLLVSSCASTPENEPKGIVSLTIKFPEKRNSEQPSQVYSLETIPVDTNLIEIVIQKDGNATWSSAVVTGNPGETATVTFYISEGTYKIHVMAKNEEGYPSVLAFGEAENVIVEKDKITEVPITLYELYYDFADTLNEALSGDLISLNYKLKVPKNFADDFLHSGVSLHGSLENALSDHVTFLPTVKATEIINEIEYETIDFTSEEFNVPIVATDTTYEWYSSLYIQTSKWKQYRSYSPKKSIVIKIKQTGIIIIID